MPVHQVLDVVYFRFALCFVKLERLTIQDLWPVWPCLLTHLLLVAILTQGLQRSCRQELAIHENLSLNILIAVEVISHEQ